MGACFRAVTATEYIPTATFMPSPRHRFNLKTAEREGWCEEQGGRRSLMKNWQKKAKSNEHVIQVYLAMVLFDCSLARTLFWRSSSFSLGASCRPSSLSSSGGLIMSQKKDETLKPPGFFRCIKSMTTPKRGGMRWTSEWYDFKLFKIRKTVEDSRSEFMVFRIAPFTEIWQRLAYSSRAFCLLKIPGRLSRASFQLLNPVGDIASDVPVSFRSLAWVRACRFFALSPSCGSSLQVKIMSRLCERRSLMSL